MSDNNWATGGHMWWDRDIHGNRVDLYVDPETGEPITRTPTTHPYSFESYILWQHASMGRDEARTAGGSAYSDRLYQWDYDKCVRLYKKHQGDNQGQLWENPTRTQAFLREYNDDPELVLTMIIACCNVSSGYPLWAFMWVPGENAK